MFCRPVTNFDEITFHFIDCIHSHLQNSKQQVVITGAVEICTLNNMCKINEEICMLFILCVLF